MGDPIARCQNPFPKNIVEFVKNLPKKEMSENDFKSYMVNCKWGAEKFFKTYYQLCCQVGLYYIDENGTFHPRFSKDISENEAKEYLSFWFSRYYVPNPYTKGFLNLEKPILVEYSIYEYLKKNKDNSAGTVFKEIFKESIGNPDIFINAINLYSNLIKIENERCFIRKGVEKVEIFNNRDDRKAFFNSFNKNTNNIEKLPFPHNRIIFGAPGTGKSHKLAEDCKKNFPEENQTSQLTVEEIVRKELSEIGNNYSKCYALGFAFSDFIKTRKPKILRETYGCNAEAAYITYQGGRAVDFYKQLSGFNEDEGDSEKILEALKMIPVGQSMKEAGSAAVGRKFSSYLYGKSISEIRDDLGLAETETQSRFIWIGANSVDYDFKTENKSIKYTERVTFHPNYSYAQFVGTYKPVSEETEDGKNEISYRYVPGPFMRVYVNAVKNHEKNFLLLIEEINRANVAAVFGDVFQLLDRNAAGESEYPIAAGEDIKKYLLSKGISCDELKIPSNMYIWATMNSADQGVMPMDAAFKRRWDFEYLDIDEGESDIKDIVIPVPDGAGEDKKIKWENVNWNELRTAINSTLKTIPGVNEDKLLGPFFIGNKEKIEELKKDSENFNKLFKSKVLMYLFEDVVKMNPGKLFDCGDNKKPRYSEICKYFDANGTKIFRISVEIKKSEINSDSTPEA